MGCCLSRSDGPNSPHPGRLPSHPVASPIIGRTTNSGPSSPVISPLPPPAITSSPVVVPDRVSRRRNRLSGLVASSPSRQQQQQQQRQNSSSAAAGGVGGDGVPTLTQRLNVPLRRHQPWTATGERAGDWTRESVDRFRSEFWDTRNTGREEIWQALRAAIELLREGLSPSGDNAGRRDEISTSSGTAAAAAEKSALDATNETTDASNLATAQLILDAAGVLLPTGDLANGAYDVSGRYYALPEIVVSDPTNLHQQHSQSDEGDATTHEKSSLDNANRQDDDLDYEHDDPEIPLTEVQRQRRRDQKGKAPLDEKDLISVRLKMSDASPDVHLRVDRKGGVRALVSGVREERKMPADYKIKIASMGKVLPENASTLEELGWDGKTVLHAFILGLPKVL